MTLDINPTPNTIAFGGSQTNLSGNRAHDFWAVDVPAGTSQLTVRTSGGTGALYLYVFEGEVPYQATCQSTNYSTTLQICSVQSPAAGKWTILIVGSTYSGVTLDINPTS